MVISNIVKRSMAASVVSLIGFSTVFSAAPSLAAITNGGFETGDFTGWVTEGNARIETSAFGSGPKEGTYQALTLTFDPSSSALQLEKFLNLADGTLSNLGNGTVINGSAIKQTFSANAGEELTFDWNFFTNEATPSQDFNDFAFVSLSSVQELADTGFSTFHRLIPTPFRNETGFQKFSYKVQTSGMYTLGIGVTNVNDIKENNSGLLVDNVKLASVPEPGSMLGVLAVGAFGATSLLKRKQQQKATAKA